MFHHAKCRLGLFVVVVVAWVAGSTLLGTAANAQEGYKTLSVLQDPSQIRNLQRTKQRALSDSSFADNRAEVEMWYKHFFRSFTVPDEFGNLPRKRKELRQDFEKSERSPALRQYLTGLANTYLKEYVTNARGNYHPAVRFNAMLAIGDLNDAERAGKKHPAPSRDSLVFMLGQYRAKTQIDAVRVAALLGMLRHAKFDWVNPRMGDSVKGEIAAEMLQLLKQTEVPESRDPAAHLWLQRRAVDVLASLGVIGKMPEAFQVIDGIVANQKADIQLRCTAASALALLDPQAAQVNVADASVKLGALAAAASRHDLAWVDDYKRRKAAESQTAPDSEGFSGLVSSTGEALDENNAAQMMGVEVEVEEMDMSTGFDGLMGGSASGAGEEEDPEVRIARRRFLTNLYCIKKGLDGLAAAAAARPQQKAQVDNVMAQFDQLVAAVSPKVTPDLDGLAKGIRKAVREMERFTQRAKPAAATPVPVGAAAANPGAPTGG